MNSELSIFAARLRDFISICAEEADDFRSNCGFRDHLDIEFNGMAIMLFTLQFKTVPGYRNFCESRGVAPGSIAHWTRIPAIPASAFKDLELTSVTPADRKAVFFSSGTTERRPSRHFHSSESLALYETALWTWFEAHLVGRQAANRTPVPVFLTPGPEMTPNSSLVHMFETVRSRLAGPQSAYFGELASDGSWTLDLDRITTMLRQFETEPRPVLLLGTAFSFVHLLEHLSESRVTFRLPPNSRAMETGGYKGRSRVMPRPELHQLISEKLGIPQQQIVSEYGMSELSSQAYDGDATRLETSEPPGERLFRFPPWVRARVISPETGSETAIGETGLLRILDLANTYSVMAVQTEDLAIRREHGFELIGRAAGSKPRGCSIMSHIG